MQQPVEVQVDEHEPIVERVAAIDVAKASGMVCLRLPHETIPGRRVTKVWPVRSTTAALVEPVITCAPSGWPGWWWSPRRTTGARSTTCSRRPG